jgi:uncharacterized membrane protein YecN with MAPEG domain
MIISYLCVAFLGLLVFGLGLNVSLHRIKTKTAGEDIKNPTSGLFRARIAHSNAAQYCPMFAVLILLNQGSLATAFGLLAVVARYTHAFGFVAFPDPGRNLPRFWGAVGTYVSGLALSLILLFTHMPL